MNAIITPKATKSVHFQPAVTVTADATTDPAAHLNSNVSMLDTTPRPANIVRPKEFGLKLATPELAPIAPDLEDMTVFGSSTHAEEDIEGIAQAIGQSAGMNTDSFERYVESMTHLWSSKNAHRDINALVQEVLREAYLIQCDQLRDYADKVKFHNNQKKAIREQLNQARTMTFDEAGNRTSRALEAHTFENSYGQSAAGTSTNVTAAPKETSSAHDTSPEPAQQLAEPLQAAAPRTLESSQLNSQGHGQGSEIGGQGEETIRETAAKAYDMFEAYWLDLSDEEKLALENQVRNDGGLGIIFTGDEEDPTFNDRYVAGHRSIPETAKIGDHETISEYVKAALDEMADKMVHDYKSHDDGWFGGQADVGYHCFSIVTPTTQYDAVEIQNLLNQTPQQAVRPQRSVALGGFGNASASEGGGSWMETGSIETETQRDDYVKALEDRLNSVGDDAQLANVDLQSCLQKQQQLLSMMSNISKTLHETAMSIIRKMGS